MFYGETVTGKFIESKSLSLYGVNAILVFSVLAVLVSRQEIQTILGLIELTGYQG